MAMPATPAPGAASMTCSNCGTANTPESRFCASCGTRLAADSPPTAPASASWPTAPAGPAAPAPSGGWAPPSTSTPWGPPPTGNPSPYAAGPGSTAPPPYGAPPIGLNQPPPYPGPYGPPRSTNGLAVASLVLSIVWLCGLGSLLAVVFGLIARGQIRAARGRQTGDGLATAGIILGAIGVIGMVGLIILGALSPDETTTYCTYPNC